MLATPARRLLDPRFAAIDQRLQSLESAVDRLVPLALGLGDGAGIGLSDEPGRPGPTLTQVARQASLLARVDVSEHNRTGTPPSFSHLVSQAASAAQCADPAYLAWVNALTGEEHTAPLHNRKLWEWAYIAEAVAQAGLLEPGRGALGFGVGNEPLPALFASKGLDVIATDQGAEGAAEWGASGQLMSGLDGLARPHLLDAGTLAERVTLRNVNMNSVPDDLGTFDVIWSSCSIEHLGSPQRGLDFALETCHMLNPGGVAVHTTELELTRREVTADYGNCAVYRIPDLEAFRDRVTSAGFEISLNFTVPMDTPEDRWISLVGVEGDAAPHDVAHLRLALHDSVTTSFGLLIARPA
jgi:SAM-dependent methyltransferase